MRLKLPMIRIDPSLAISALITPYPAYRSTLATFSIKNIFLFETENTLFPFSRYNSFDLPEITLDRVILETRSIKTRLGVTTIPKILFERSFPR